MDWYGIFTGFLKFWDKLARLWQLPLKGIDWVMEYIGKGLAMLVAAIIGLFPGAVDPFVEHQIAGSIGYAPWAVISSPFRRQYTEQVEASKAMAGGFIRGICHAGAAYERLPEANIEWERMDVPFPYDYTKDGSPSKWNEGDESVSAGFASFKANLAARSAFGLKTMLVTPFPKTFIGKGIDPRTPEGEAKVVETIKYIFNELKAYAGAVQIANEMGVAHFTNPLTTEQAARFLQVQLQALHPIRGSVLIGYNTAGPQMDINSLMKPYLQYCDFYGLDMYLGCHFGFGNWMWVFDVITEMMWSYLQLPMIVTEFGYLSAGAPKTRAEKDALLLERFGFPNEAAIRADPEGFLDAMTAYNKTMGDNARAKSGSDPLTFLFSLEWVTHLYAELPADYVIKKYPHTPEGQAGFFKDIIPRFAKYPFVIGEFVYNWKDSEMCYICGQSDCPTETGWGLNYFDGTPKPAYYEVRDAFGKLK